MAMAHFPPPLPLPAKKKRTRTLTMFHQSAMLHALLSQVGGSNWGSILTNSANAIFSLVFASKLAGQLG